MRHGGHKRRTVGGEARVPGRGAHSGGFAVVAAWAAWQPASMALGGAVGPSTVRSARGGSETALCVVTWVAVGTLCSGMSSSCDHGGSLRHDGSAFRAPDLGMSAPRLTGLGRALSMRW